HVGHERLDASFFVASQGLGGGDSGGSGRGARGNHIGLGGRASNRRIRDLYRFLSGHRSGGCNRGGGIGQLVIDTGEQALHGDVVGGQSEQLLEIGFGLGQIAGVTGAKPVRHQADLSLGLALRLNGGNGHGQQHGGGQRYEERFGELGGIHQG